MGLAGTDWEQHRHFAESAESYRRQLVKTMNDDLAYRSISRRYEADVRGRPSWEAVPDFAYEPPALGWILARQRLPWLVLCTWLTVAVLALGRLTSHLETD